MSPVAKGGVSPAWEPRCSYLAAFPQRTMASACQQGLGTHATVSVQPKTKTIAKLSQPGHPLPQSTWLPASYLTSSNCFS